jgi:hypothetical protein
MTATTATGPSARPTPDWMTSARKSVRTAIRKVRCENGPISRYGFNLLPIVRYKVGVTPLNVTAHRVARELRQEGVAMTTLEELLEDDAALQRLQAYVESLRNEVLNEGQNEEGELSSFAKSFLIELLGERPVLMPGSPLVRLALHPQIKGVAEAYSGMKLRVQDVNAWVNLPRPNEAEQSQLWHRDLPEDHDIVKCFIYVRPVRKETGPMRYVRRSNTAQGRRVRFPSEWDGIGYRIPDQAVYSVVPDEYVLEATGPAGSVVFADTRGLHRGGHATGDERLVVQITYASNACCRPRNLIPADGAAAEQLTDFRLAR